MNDFIPTPEELEYFNIVTSRIVELIPPRSEDAQTLQVTALISALNPDALLAFIYSMIAYGYILKDDEIMGTKKSFSINDFLEKK